MKDNPMQGIKYALAFVLGALYAGCWWATLSDASAPWIILPIVGIIFGSWMIMLGTLLFFADHW